jgi:hypothetical protein
MCQNFLKQGGEGTEVTVNQHFFAATLFRDLSVVNWIAASNFRDQAIFINKVHIICNIWFATRNIRDGEALAKFSRSRIKVGLQ